jgi:hypothetical protein
MLVHKTKRMHILSVHVQTAVYTTCMLALGTQGLNFTCPKDYHSSSLDPDWVKFGSKCYRDATGEWSTRPWKFCGTTCRDLYCDDGYCGTAALVTVESAEEEEFLETQFPSNPSCCGEGSQEETSCCKWIGLGFVSADSKQYPIPAGASEAGASWIWQSGRVSQYRNWAAGEPKQNAGCAVLGRASDGWQTESCFQEEDASRHRCICEISFEPTPSPTTPTPPPSTSDPIVTRDASSATQRGIESILVAFILQACF